MDDNMETMNQEPKKKPDLFGMIWSPGEQLDRIRERPSIWLAMLIVTVISLAGTLLMFISFDIGGAIDEDLGEEFFAFAKIFSIILGIITGLFTPVLSILVSSAILLIITMIAKSDVTFKQLFSMNTYLYMISAIGICMNGLIYWAFGGQEGIYITSLAGFINSDSAILGAIELFSIWHLILLALGLQKVARLSKGLSWTLVIIFFLISIGMGYMSDLFSRLGTM